jgi:tRNA1(Val) A37 N6-methylase TrmN6
MSVFNEILSKFKQNLSSKSENKALYGEVFTSFLLIDKILDLLPDHLWSNKNLKWLDPCAGTGYFAMKIYKRLYNKLSDQIKDAKKRHYHIIKNQLYMIEINKEHIETLYRRFGDNANIIMGDYLEYENMNFDVIVGNPPFNVEGLIKVPTNSKQIKKMDGKTIWQQFIIHSLSNLNNGGWMAMITPSIWLKKDHRIFEFIKYNTDNLKLACLTNTETNQIFNNQAQTPTCYFSLQKSIYKSIVTKKALLFDKMINNYVSFSFNNISLPLCYGSIIEKILKYTRDVGCIKVNKTNMRPDYKGLILTKTKTEKTPYPNISTCKLKCKTKPELVINYSNKKCHYADIKKLILAHKMYGFPYYDKDGLYGISNRDNYVILNKSNEDFIKLKHFLSSRLALLVFETTRYRMKYLERYAFEFLPDITKIKNFPTIITDKSIFEFFNFNNLERKTIINITSKKYLSF